MAQGFFPAPSNDVVVTYSIPVTISCHANAASAIAAGMLVETIQTNATDVDRTALTAAAANSACALGFVLFNLANKETLAENNASPTKATTFAASDRVDVGLRVPVIEAILAAGQGTVLPGAKLASHGTAGALKAHPSNLTVNTHTTGTNLTTTTTGYAPDITVAISLSRATTSAATQVIQVMPMW